MAMEFLGFSFCLIYPGLGSGEASKAGNVIGADQKKKKIPKKGLLSLQPKGQERGSVARQAIQTP